MESKIKYPYLPEGREIKYAPMDNIFMFEAFVHARSFALDKTMPGAAILVQAGMIIGWGANGSDYHKTHQCQRVILGCKSGEGYDLCEGCHPKNHSEAKAIANARARGIDPAGADLYLWGHWWCCKPCWEKIIEAGIANVYLLSGSEILFNKEHPENIVGRQLELKTIAKMLS